MKIFYTFGTDDRFPFRGGWVEVHADSITQAHAIFRANHPDRTPGVLNCSDFYTEASFNKSDMSRTGNLGAFCHETLSAAPLYVNAEKLLADMKAEAERMIRTSDRYESKTAWYWSHIGAIDMTRQLGLITDERRLALYREIEDLKPTAR